VKGITTEQLRAFLTSVLVSKSKSRTVMDWVRSRAGHPFTPGPAVVTKEEEETEV
jgi:hypothetical protein